MVVVRRQQTGPRGGASWRQTEVRTGALVMIRSRYEGAYKDETFSPELAEDCSSIRFVLGGPLVVRAGQGTLDLREGQIHASRTHGTARARSLTPGTDVLFVGWRGESRIGDKIAHDVRLTPSPATSSRLRALAEMLEDEDASSSHVAIAARQAMTALRAEGFPLHDVAITDASHDEQRLATTIERCLAPLASQPTSIDLSRALDVGEHHALRRANRHFDQFYFAVKGWREYLRRRRLDLGAFFMGRPDARTEEVARVLGFRSPTSFCHAFQAAGLPSPRAVQNLLLAS